MEIALNDWQRYVLRLSRLGNEATQLGMRYVKEHGTEDVQAFINYAYQVSTTLGESAAALACQMYDEVAEASKVNVPPAVPAETATYGEVAAAVTVVADTSPVQLPSVMGRMVKQAAADTTLQNARRDGAKFAWIPHGDTCAFCLMLAANGWQYMSKNALKNGHARHIHNNCDCEYAISFDRNPKVEGYDPEKYKRIYDAAEGATWQEKLNYMRREQYAEEKAVEEVAKAFSFTPASSLSEAEEYAKQFVWDYRGNVSYKGMSLEYANDVNRVLGETFDRFSPEKISSIEPMNFRTKNFRTAVEDGVLAAYKWGNGVIYINQKVFASEKTLNNTLNKVETLYKTVVENAPTLAQSQTVTGSQKTYLAALVRSGRQCIATDVPNAAEATIVHEIGHMLDDRLFRRAFRERGFSITESKSTFGEGISGYAVSSNNEYVAESFAAYWYGMTDILDPELVSIFEGFDKWKITS